MKNLVGFLCVLSLPVSAQLRPEEIPAKDRKITDAQADQISHMRVFVMSNYLYCLSTRLSVDRALPLDNYEAPSDSSNVAHTPLLFIRANCASHVRILMLVGCVRDADDMLLGWETWAFPNSVRAHTAGSGLTYLLIYKRLEVEELVQYARRSRQGCTDLTRF